MQTCCAPTGLDDTPPATMRIAGRVFYFYGPGGGGVDYPDQYLMELSGKILAFSLADRGRTPDRRSRRRSF